MMALAGCDPVPCRASARCHEIVADNNFLYGVIMIRTQVSLSEEEYEAAKREAQRLGISLAELLRRSLRSILPEDESKPWMRYAGLVETGDSRSSEHIDDIVYGDKG
jgi:hypothetical protein